MHTTRYFVRRTLVALAVAGAVSMTSATFAQERLSGKPTKEQILQALTPQQSQSGPAFRTRGLSLGGGDAVQPAPEAAPQTSAGTGSGGGKQAAPAPAARASARALDLEIPFEFNSDRLTQDGREVLDQLGEALKSDELSGARRITLEGHTDARGNSAYNNALSLRRAQSVRTFLSSKHAIPTMKLRAVGKGSSELADPKNPEDSVNRRVRIIVEG